jgi:hypothetical protein
MMTGVARTRSSRKDCLKIGLPCMDNNNSASCGLAIHVPSHSHLEDANTTTPRKLGGVRYSDLVGSITSTGALLNHTHNGNAVSCSTPCQRRHQGEGDAVDTDTDTVESGSDSELRIINGQEQEDPRIADGGGTAEPQHFELQEEPLYVQFKPAFDQLCFPSDPDPEAMLTVEASSKTVATCHFQDETSKHENKHTLLQFPSSSVIRAFPSLTQNQQDRGVQHHRKEQETYQNIRELEAEVDCCFEDIMMNLRYDVTEVGYEDNDISNWKHNMMNDLPPGLSGQDIHQGGGEASDENLAFLQRFVYD